MCMFTSECPGDYEKHLLAVHNSYKCKEAGCMKLFGSEKLLYRHLYLDHGEDSKILSGKLPNTPNKPTNTQEKQEFLLNRRKSPARRTDELFGRRDSLMNKGRKIAISFIKNVKRLIIETGMNEFSIPLDPRSNESHWTPGRCAVSEYQVASIAMLLLFSVARSEPTLPFKRTRLDTTLSDMFAAFDSKPAQENKDPVSSSTPSFKCSICEERFFILKDLQSHYTDKHC